MDPKIRDAHHEVYQGEAKAAFRLRLYAGRAEQEGFNQIAKLFRAIARSEEIHGERSLRLLEPIKDTQTNLQAAFESEQKVAGLAYPGLIKAAMEANDRVAETLFTQSRDVEETHAKLYKNALEHLAEERDTSYYVCTVCGYVADGSLPDKCPVCNVKSDRFVQY
jgi:rubrerythrin